MGQVLEGRSGVPIGGSDDGRLWTYAVSISEEHQANVEGCGYVLALDGIGTNGAEHIVVMKNTSPEDMLVTTITMFVAEYKSTTRVKVLLNESFTYAANGTVVVPTNVRSGVVGGAQGEFYTLAAGGTDITTFTGTSTIGGIYVFERYPLKFSTDSGWVIPPGQVFSLFNVGNDNTFYGHISFYYHQNGH